MLDRIVFGSTLVLALLGVIGCGDDDDASPEDDDAGMQHHADSGLLPDSGKPDLDSGSSKHDGGEPMRDGGPINCTTSLASGLVIDVKPESGWSCSNLEVTAFDGSYSEKLQRFDCRFQGAAERRGTYDVRIEGYGRSLTIPNIKVASNVCHVETEFRRVRFTHACTESDSDAGDEDAGTAPEACVVVTTASKQ